MRACLSVWVNSSPEETVFLSDIYSNSVRPTSASVSVWKMDSASLCACHHLQTGSIFPHCFLFTFIFQMKRHVCAAPLHQSLLADLLCHCQSDQPPWKRPFWVISKMKAGRSIWSHARSICMNNRSVFVKARLNSKLRFWCQDWLSRFTVLWNKNDNIHESDINGMLSIPEGGLCNQVEALLD